MGASKSAFRGTALRIERKIFKSDKTIVMNCNAKLGRGIIVVFFLGIFVSLSFGATAADTTLLNVGDKIPELKYDKWLKGTPFKGYQKGRLYIFEFWATWCGPCRQAMPHLSGIAAKYKDQLTVVGVDIWENDENHHATVTPEKFVKQMGSNMAYNVVTDTKDQWMGNKWMKAAGQEGIPCSFMVKDGIILWIGHPINLDSVIKVVNSGKYDPVAVQAEFKRKAEAQKEQEAANHRVMDPIESAIKAKEWAKAFDLMEDAKKQLPEWEQYLDFRKFQVLLDNLGEDSAINYARRWQSDPQAQFTASAGAIIFAKKGLSKDSYMFGIELIRKVIARQPEGPTPLYEEFIAGGYAAAGDYKTAVDTLQSALNEAKQAIREGKLKGMIGQDTVDKMEKELAEYKSHLK